MYDGKYIDALRQSIHFDHTQELVTVYPPVFLPPENLRDEEGLANEQLIYTINEPWPPTIGQTLRVLRQEHKTDDDDNKMTDDSPPGSPDRPPVSLTCSSSSSSSGKVATPTGTTVQPQGTEDGEMKEQPLKKIKLSTGEMREIISTFLELQNKCKTLSYYNQFTEMLIWFSQTTHIPPRNEIHDWCRDPIVTMMTEHTDIPCTLQTFQERVTFQDERINNPLPSTWLWQIMFPSGRIDLPLRTFLSTFLTTNVPKLPDSCLRMLGYVRPRDIDSTRPFIITVTQSIGSDQLIFATEPFEQEDTGVINEIIDALHVPGMVRATFYKIIAYWISPMKPGQSGEMTRE
jgi:hypothetical protein